MYQSHFPFGHARPRHNNTGRSRTGLPATPCERRRMKEAMHSAARHTMKAIMGRRAVTVPEKVQALFQMTRAIARVDVGMARKAVHSLPPLSVCVRIDTCGVAIAQPRALAELAGALVRADLMERTAGRAGDAAAAGGKPRGVQAYIRRWQGLWASAEVLAEPDGDLDDAAGAAPRQPHERLHQHWEAHFAFKPVDMRLAQALMRRFGTAEVEVGPLAGGWSSPAPTSMYLVCIPKGIRPEEWAVVTRVASKTRPLGLKNTDVKLMASCIARSVNQGLEIRISDRQRGLLRGRLAMDNIAELNVAGRIAALQTEAGLSNPERLPLLWALDIRAAFPALAQYRVRALIVLAYTAQIRAPPRALQKMERIVSERLLKMPHNAVPTAVLASLPELGIPAPPAAHYLCIVTLARAAATSAARRPMHRALDEAREEHLPLAPFAQRRPDVPGLDNAAIVDTWTACRIGELSGAPGGRRHRVRCDGKWWPRPPGSAPLLCHRSVAFLACGGCAAPPHQSSP